MISRLAAALAGLALVACASSPVLYPTSAPRPQVLRLDDDRVKIRWPEGFSRGAVAVYAGLSPDAIDRSRPVARGTGTSVTLVRSNRFPYTAREFRVYYELVPTGGEPVIVSERLLPLECCDNFRDLGGYVTGEGRDVLWNRLYRSDDLSELSRDDLAYLTRMGVKLVCDFRSDRERNSAPNGFEEGDPLSSVDLPVDTKGVDPDLFREQIRTGGIAALAAHEIMVEAYRSFVTDYSKEWSIMFERLAQPGNLPTVVHCTAGKDRTGFASALVLLAVGVPEATVFEDYLSTNRYQGNLFDFVRRWVPLYSFFRTDPDDLLPILEARPEYLRAALDVIAERHGNVDTYLEEALRVTPEMRATLRVQLLGP